MTAGSAVTGVGGCGANGGGMALGERRCASRGGDGRSRGSAGSLPDPPVLPTRMVPITDNGVTTRILFLRIEGQISCI